MFFPWKDGKLLTGLFTRPLDVFCHCQNRTNLALGGVVFFATFPIPTLKGSGKWEFHPQGDKSRPFGAWDGPGPL